MATEPRKLSENGVPQEVVVSIPDGDLEAVFNSVTHVRAQQATEQARRISEAQGTDRMSMDEIDAEIASTRRDIASRETSPGFLPSDL